MSSYLKIDRVRKTFASGSRQTEVLADVTLAIEKGEFVSIIGHSGCGKTTLLNIVAGLTRATTGGVLLEDSQDGVAVVVRRPQCWLRHGVSVLDNTILSIAYGVSVMPVVCCSRSTGIGEPWLQANSSSSSAFCATAREFGIRSSLSVTCPN